jgi:hypothetical protein
MGRAMGRKAVAGIDIYDVTWRDKKGALQMQTYPEAFLVVTGDPLPNIIPNQPDKVEEAEVEKALPFWMAWFRRSRARA